MEHRQGNPFDPCSSPATGDQELPLGDPLFVSQQSNEPTTRKSNSRLFSSNLDQLASGTLHQECAGGAGIALLASKIGGSMKCRYSIARAGCPAGQGRLVETCDYYDSAGSYYDTKWVFLTECASLTDLEKMVALLNKPPA